MLPRADLNRIARARLQDAEKLLLGRRYDGAIYLCGYAIETALKARICKTLRWQAYPSTRSEFRDYQSFRTHNLEVLLRLSGVEQRIKTEHATDWSLVCKWDPEIRYHPIGSAEKHDAELMIRSTVGLLKTL